MPQISTIGTGGTYTTLSAWTAAEGGNDYGAGNPAIGEFLELVNESVAVTGVFVRGYILRAQSGLELDKSTLVGVGNEGDTRANVSTSGVVAAHENIIVNNSAFVSTSSYTYTDCYIQDNMSVTNKDVTLTGCIGKGMSRFLDATGGNSNAIANNCTAIDNTGSFSFVRFKVTNCLNIGGASQGFAATVAGSDYNASDDTTAPGANSLQNRTTADLVDYAGGDYRTASGSALATSGLSGAFIGFALEAGGGGGLTVDDILSNQVITQPILSTGSQLTTDNIINSQLLSNADLSQGYTLTTDGLLSQQSLSEPLLTQANILSVEGLSNNQSLTNVTLAVAGGLSVQSLLNNQNLSEPALTQQNQLTVDDVLNNQTLSAAELIQGFLLSVNDISSNQELTSPLLDVDGSLSVQSLVSYQTISEPTITQHIALITNNLTQGQFIGNVRLNEEDQTIGTVTAAFKESGIDVKYGIASFTIKFKD